MTKRKAVKIFSKLPTLMTERLILRKLLPSDYKDMYEYASRPESTEYLLWSPHISQDQTYRYLEAIQTSYKRGDFFDWAVVFRKSGKMIGTCGYTSFDDSHSRAEIGYVLNPDYWGLGIAAEAVMAAEEFAFRELGINRVEARYIEGNDRSRRVMEKCGMRFEGMFRQYMLVKGEYKNIGICAVTKDEFIGRAYYRKEYKSGWLKKIT